MMNHMNILLISDISWERSGLKLIKDKILDIRPSLILFAGDIISDGSCSKIHIDELLELLEFLNKNKIHSFIIQGNHDDDINYKKLLYSIEKLSHIKDISNKIAKFNNIKILGIPFSFTHSMRNVRKMSETFPEQVDIVLAHSEKARRIWLFDLNTKIIATGHYDEQLFHIFDKVFIAFGGFPYNYVTVDYDINEQIITYFSISGNKDRISKARLTNGRLIWSQNLIRQREYPDYMSIVENLVSAKKKVINIETRRDVIENLLKMKIPKQHIIEYVGREYRELIEHVSDKSSEISMEMYDVNCITVKEK